MKRYSRVLKAKPYGVIVGLTIVSAFENKISSISRKIRFLEFLENIRVVGVEARSSMKKTSNSGRGIVYSMR
jgi:hypothetical protein